MKNELFLVFGGRYNSEKSDYDDLENVRGTIKTFKNKDIALKYADTLIDGYMKTKSYSSNYQICDWIKPIDSILDISICDIINKKDETVYSVEIQKIDLSKIIM